MNQDFVDKFSTGLKNLGIVLTNLQMEQFYQYYELLIDWNRVMNLTAITEMDEVIHKHFIDSLSLIWAVDDLAERSADVIDVGTGAGFPGIPLKIAFPQLRITLLDSLNKRIRFLDEVISRLGLKQIATFHGRAEDYGRDLAHREQYDLCVSRAVANTATLSEYCLPFVRVGGYFLPYKSGQIDEELIAAKNAVKLLGGNLEKVVRFCLADTDVERAIVQVRKVRPTSKKYPRKAGLPGKEPL
ncbi:MAG: 16S rRNA (guanine(527)-N(7))-methyltransferase RsmG [Clostridiales bacterium]|nr:16S rRNA (guanine(527)-N(7))-methyltransferase RsmG [Clostridiales bacterium]